MTATCEIAGCGKPRNNGGGRFCSMHYSRLRRNGDPLIRTFRVYVTHLPCVIEGCDERQAGLGLCQRHWMRNKRRGDPLAPSLRGRHWTADELRRLELVLNSRPDGLGHGRPHEVAELALLIGRTVSAVSSRLHAMRQARKERQTAAVIAGIRRRALP